MCCVLSVSEEPCICNIGRRPGNAAFIGPTLVQTMFKNCCYSGSVVLRRQGKRSRPVFLLTDEYSHSRTLRMSSMPQLSRRAALTLFSQVLLYLAGTASVVPSRAAVHPDSRARVGAGAIGERALPERRYDGASIVTTSSGLRYFDLSIGDTSGAEIRKANVVTIAYTTRLGGLNGIKLDSSYDHGNDFRFTVGSSDIIPGLNEAILGMRPGGKRRVVLPPPLAYSNPDMQPAVKEFFARRRLLSVLNTNRDATIVMDIEIIRVRDTSEIHIGDSIGKYPEADPPVIFGGITIEKGKRYLTSSTSRKSIARWDDAKFCKPRPLNKR